MAGQGPEDYERAAAGLDLDEENHDRDPAGSFLSGGPEALLENIEEMIPEPWRQQIVAYPIAAIFLGVGIGVFLGMKKGTEILAAGTAMVSAAATSNLSHAISREHEG